MSIPSRGNWILLKNDSKTWLEAYMCCKEKMDLIKYMFIEKITSKWGNVDIAIAELVTEIGQMHESSLAKGEPKYMTTFEQYGIQHDLKHSTAYSPI